MVADAAVALGEKSPLLVPSIAWRAPQRFSSDTADWTVPRSERRDH
jgi:hypothetical protein